jgi:hypothetical protein
MENYGDKVGTKKDILYRDVRAVVTGKKWFIQFYYRVPDALREAYGKKWERFKVYEDINRIKTLEYATKLRQAVLLALEDGFSPFDQEAKVVETKKIKVWTVQQAILYFKQKWVDRGLEPSSIYKYMAVAVAVGFHWIVIIFTPFAHTKRVDPCFKYIPINHLVEVSVFKGIDFYRVIAENIIVDFNVRDLHDFQFAFLNMPSIFPRVFSAA